MPNWVTIKQGSDNFDSSQSTVGGAWKTIKPATGKSKEEISQQSQLDAEKYAQESQGGVLNWINRKIGRGVSMPTLAQENPEYTQKRIASEQDVQKGLGTRAKELFTGYASETAFDVFEQDKLDKLNLKNVEERNKSISTLVERNKNEKDESVKERRAKSINNLLEQNKQLVQEAGGDLKNKDFLQLVGQSVGTALDLTPFLGFSTFGTQAVKFVGQNLLKQGVKTFTKEAIKQIAEKSAELSAKQVIKQGTAEAGLYGTFSGLGGGLEDKNRTIGSVAKSTAIGGALGAGLGLGLGVIGKYAGKLFEKRATRKAEQEIIASIEKKLTNIDSDEKSIIREAIKDNLPEDEIIKQVEESRKAIDEVFTPEKVEVKAEDPLIQEAKNWHRGENVNGQGIVGKELGLPAGDKFYSNSPSEEKTYAGAGGKVINPTEMPKNPLVISNKRALADEMGFKGNPTGEPIKGQPSFDELAKQYAQSKGNDGIIYNKLSTANGYYKDAPQPMEMHTWKSQPLQEGVSKSHAEVNTLKVEPEREKSAFAERLNKELPENFKIDEEYDIAHLKSESDNAAELIAKDKDKAIRIASGAEKSSGNTQTAVSIELAEKAKQAEDWESVSSLFNTRRLANTRRGQEIAMEKISIALSPEEKYMKQVIEARTKKVKIGFDDIKKGETKEKKVSRKIERDNAELKNNLKQSFKIKEAQTLLDKLTCKL